MSKLRTGHQRGGDEIDRLVALMADESHRRVVAYFQDAATDVATLDELVAHRPGEAGEDEDVRGPEEAGEDEDARETEAGTGTEAGTSDRVAIDLHHSVLPELADAGLLDYDARTNTVRYHGHPVLDEGGPVPGFGGE